MAIRIITSSIAAAIVWCAAAQAQSWQNSPLNWQNSPYNYNNSPLNWQNSPYNLYSNRSIYDSDGNRWGYVVPREDGSGINIFPDRQERRWR